jgi:hypothetical protein
MDCISENETRSLDEIAEHYSLSVKNPILYGLYIQENPLLTQPEKDRIQTYMTRLIQKQRNINKINLAYMERHVNTEDKKE